MPTRKLIEIERLRGAAILVIMTSHLQILFPAFSVFWRRQWPMVDLFFVISGFVITISLVRWLPTFEPGTPWEERLDGSWPALRIFFFRRFCRVMPTVFFLIALTGLLVYLFNAHGSFGTPENYLKESVSLLSGFYNYLFGRAGFGSVFAHCWSLAVEEQFYFVAPFVFLLLPRRGSRLIAALAIVIFVALILRPFTESEFALAKMTTHRKFDGTWAGVALALVIKPWEGSYRIDHLIRGKSFIAPAFFLLLLCLQGVLYSKAAPYQLVTPALEISTVMVCVALVFLASRNNGWVFGQWGIRHVLEYAGERTFSLYLMHGTAFRILREVREVNQLRWSFEEQTVAAFLIAFALAEVTYWAVEKPFHEIGRRAALRNASSRNFCEQLNAA